MQSVGPMDTNNDGTLTQAEYDAATNAAFDRMDANHDGYITPQERQAAAQAARQRNAAAPKK